MEKLRYLRNVNGRVEERIVERTANKFYIQGLEKNGFELDKGFKGGKTTAQLETEIKELRAKLEKAESKTVTAEVTKPSEVKKEKGEVEAKVEKPTKEEETKEQSAVKEEKEDIEVLKASFIKKFQKPVPKRYTNDAEWIKKELEKEV